MYWMLHRCVVMLCLFKWQSYTMVLLPWVESRRPRSCIIMVEQWAEGIWLQRGEADKHTAFHSIRLPPLEVTQLLWKSMPGHSLHTPQKRPKEAKFNICLMYFYLALLISIFHFSFLWWLNSSWSRTNSCRPVELWVCHFSVGQKQSRAHLPSWAWLACPLLSVLHLPIQTDNRFSLFWSNHLLGWFFVFHVE